MSWPPPWFGPRLSGLLVRASSADVLLVIANLFQRIFGFLASLAIARLSGLDAVGLYSSLQISSSTPTTPLSMPLANSATLVASGHRQHSLRTLFAAHTPILLLFGLFTGCSSAALLALAHGAQPWTLLPAALAFLSVVLLSWGQMLSHLASGIYHGAHRAMEVALITAAATAGVMLLCLPVALMAGLPGVLLLSVIAAVAPGIFLLIRALFDPTRGPPAPLPAAEASLSHQAVSGVRHAMPSMVSTVIRNGVSWVCGIYLTQQYHGAAGVGLVTIGMQWMALMQLPVGSWGGRIVADFANPQSDGQQAGLLRHWLVKCMGTTALLGLVVACASPWIADIYRTDALSLSVLLIINGVVSVIMAGTYVQERVAFCKGKQRQWLWLSFGADSIQVILTLVLAPYSIWFIAAGSLASALVVLLGARWVLLTPGQAVEPP